MNLLFIKLFSDTDIFLMLMFFYFLGFVFTILVSIGFIIHLFGRFKEMKPLLKIGWGIVEWIVACVLGCIVVSPIFAISAFVYHGNSEEAELLCLILGILSYGVAHYLSIHCILRKME